MLMSRSSLFATSFAVAASLAFLNRPSPEEWKSEFAICIDAFKMTHHSFLASVSSNNTYEKIRPEDELSASDEEQSLYAGYGPRDTKIRNIKIVTFINVLLFVTSALMFSRSLWNTKDMDIDTAISHTSAYSPVLANMNVRLNDIKFNGSFYPPVHPSLPRLPPGDPDGEAFWEYYERLKFFPISREDVVQLGKNPETAIRFPDEVFGFGDESFVAALDLPHKIHCLNELRKMAFMGYPGPDSNSSRSEPLFYKDRAFDELWWSHLRHCTDSLAQELLCANSDVLTYNFRDTQQFAFPDFSINRKCRDLDQLLGYAEDRVVDEETYSQNVKYREGGPTRLLPMDRRHYELFGFDGSLLFPEGRGFHEYFQAEEKAA